MKVCHSKFPSFFNHLGHVTTDDKIYDAISCYNFNKQMLTIEWGHECSQSEKNIWLKEEGFNLTSQNYFCNGLHFQIINVQINRQQEVEFSIIYFSLKSSAIIRNILRERKEKGQNVNKQLTIKWNICKIRN